MLYANNAVGVNAGNIGMNQNVGYLLRCAVCASRPAWVSLLNASAFNSFSLTNIVDITIPLLKFDNAFNQFFVFYHVLLVLVAERIEIEFLVFHHCFANSALSH